ncbi:MAG: DNA polymerase III subunit delta' [candidate division WS2 bacterium ADurb.Bin280]|uniref:DNA polymerase III subunit delta n=1 Tax=candidate division WS2 bacterium ADurb.Bin280 TaxID=1852829 RepID=A0A1V5SFS7_9BACT|nr:MAG: DNA polymerase III subunit delta' [candidate division WS2 bacterium ADurb.Bin280]
MIIESGKSHLIINRSKKSDNELLKEIADSLSVSESDLIIFNSLEGVSDLRKKISSLLIKPHSSIYRILAILNGGNLSNEQANTLLKIFEEPPSYAIAIIFASNPSMVLPTIRSRCTYIDYKGNEDVCTDCVYVDLLNKSFSDYLKFISSLETDEIPDMLKNALECIKNQEGSQRDLRLFEDISKAYLRLCSSNSNAKLALESIYISNKARKKT